VEQAGHLAAFEVEHFFVNETDELLEGTFRFALPPGAIVTGLAMQIGDELMEGEIVARDKARKIYQDIVDQMRDPAILEWEQGRSFKLRVFPIEPKANKRIVLRYLAPLSVDPRRDGAYRVIYPTVAPEGQGAIDHFALRINDELVVERRDFEADGDVRVPLPRESSAADFLVESRGDRNYYAVRVTPPWEQIDSPERATGPRTRVLWLDSSRSGLESWNLAIESALALATALGDEDRLVVVSADIFARAHTPKPERPTPALLSRIEGELRGIEPDGASDFGAALNEIASLVGDLSSPVEVIYIGDGVPTWGNHDAESLGERFEALLGGARFHALALGKKADPSLLGRLVSPSQGRVVQARGAGDLRRFSTFLRYADQIKSIAIDDIELEGVPPGLSLTNATRTVFEGQELYSYFSLPADQAPPRALRLRSSSGGEPLAARVSLGAPRPSRHVAELWAARTIESVQMGRGQGEEAKTKVIELSETFGVLSRHTALLVLESDEAYRQHKIERRKAKEAAEQAEAAARVSGRDLESLRDRTRLAPGDIQPGDPEIHIPAPREARSVTVIFPFGETKVARWDESLGQWNVRFLIDAATPSGRYEVQIRIVHADGRVEMRKADYTVDTSAPHMSLQLRVHPDDDGAYIVEARQELHADDRPRQGDQSARGELPALTKWSSHDAKSVDLVMPDGQTLTLRRLGPGHFEKNWRPRGEVRWPARVELSATDRALNVRRVQLELDTPNHEAEASDGDR
jgi:hypothetical protein